VSPDEAVTWLHQFRNRDSEVRRATTAVMQRYNVPSLAKLREYAPAEIVNLAEGLKAMLEQLGDEEP
jgi:hypothetical protein